MEKFVDHRFEGKDLSLTKFKGARLQNVVFENCKLMGVNFSLVDPLLFSVQFKNCLLDMANFSGLDLKKTPFINCLIRDASFFESNLSDADFSGSNLLGTTFHHCNLTKANFASAQGYSINPLTNVLKGAKFSSPEVLSLLKHLEIVID